MVNGFLRGEMTVSFKLRVPAPDTWGERGVKGTGGGVG